MGWTVSPLCQSRLGGRYSPDPDIVCLLQRAESSGLCLGYVKERLHWDFFGEGRGIAGFVYGDVKHGLFSCIYLYTIGLVWVFFFLMDAPGLWVSETRGKGPGHQGGKHQGKRGSKEYQGANNKDFRVARSIGTSIVYQQLSLGVGSAWGCGGKYPFGVLRILFLPTGLSRSGRCRLARSLGDALDVDDWSLRNGMFIISPVVRCPPRYLV